MYEYISIENINRLKSILKNSASNKKIEIFIPSMELSLISDSVSVTLEEDEYFDGMEQVYLLNQDNTYVLKIKDREYEVFFNLGEWGYNARLPKSHLVLGTNPIKFGSDYFCQIELSQAIEDDEYIYIIKNISKLAGNGAISRLNNGLSSDKAKKHERRDMLVKRLNAEIVQFGDSDWICINKISKEQLMNEDYQEEIFGDFIQGYLLYALTIESIIAD